MTREGTEPFRIQTRWQDDVPILSVTGELDLATAPQLTAAGTRVLARGPVLIVVDLSTLSFIDASGIHALVELDARSRAQSARLKLLGPPAQAVRVLQLCGLENHFETTEARVLTMDPAVTRRSLVA